MGNSESRPWREFNCRSTPWSEEHLCELKETVPAISFDNSKGVSEGNVVAIGPAGGGKSSFINSIIGIQKLNKFLCGNVLVSDTMGFEIEVNTGCNPEDLMYLIKGHVPKDYRFEPGNHITKDSPDFKQNPSNADRVHCVIFCVNAELVWQDVPYDLVRRINIMQDAIARLNVPRVLILTKIDMIHSDDTLSNTFKSMVIKRAVKKASELFNLHEMYIHPVKNFINEGFLTKNASILLLHALKQAVAFAQDTIEELPAASLT